MRFSIRSLLYCDRSFVLMSPKCSVQPDGPPCIHVGPEVIVEGDVPAGDRPSPGVLQLPRVDALVPPAHVARGPVHRVGGALGSTQHFNIPFFDCLLGNKNIIQAGATVQGASSPCELGFVDSNLRFQTQKFNCLISRTQTSLYNAIGKSKMQSTEPSCNQITPHIVCKLRIKFKYFLSCWPNRIPG